MNVTGLLSFFIVLSPRIIIWIGGIIFAIYRHRNHPRVSNYAIVGLTILIIFTIIDVSLNFLLPQQILGSSLPSTSIGSIFAIKGVVMSILNLIPWGLIYLAIFSDREIA